MAVIQKVTIEYDDHIKTLEGEQAKIWEDKCIQVSLFVQAHGQNPFDVKPYIEWAIKKKEKKDASMSGHCF